MIAVVPPPGFGLAALKVSIKADTASVRSLMEGTRRLRSKVKENVFKVGCGKGNGINTPPLFFTKSNCDSFLIITVGIKSANTWARPLRRRSRDLIHPSRSLLIGNALIDAPPRLTPLHP